MIILKLFLYFIDVSIHNVAFLKFEFWFSGSVNGWNLAHWNHRRRNPIFDHEKPFLTIKRALLTNLKPFFNHQVSSVCHFRLWSSDSRWFKLIQTESKSRIRKPEFPKIKTNTIFHAFPTNLPVFIGHNVIYPFLWSILETYTHKLR